MKNTSTHGSVARKAWGVLLGAAVLLSPVAAQQVPKTPAAPVIRVLSELVLVNVTVRDKKGNFVRGLKPEDFTVLEDKKRQKIVSFDFEDINHSPAPGPPQETVLVKPPTAAAPQTHTASLTDQLKHRRLIVLFFDLSSMQPDEIDRGVQAAEKYVAQQMSPADLVGVVSLASSFEVNLDFTDDRAQLRRVLDSFSSGSGQGFEEGSTGDTEGTPDTGAAFTPDETEYNIFNADRRLDALRQLAGMLADIEQKKSVIYISSGMTRTGIDNQSELRAAVNAAVHANLSIYTLDVRGLEAMVPGGEARQASLRGVSPYSGASMRSAFNSNFNSQDTLVTLASDTGGRAFLDTNDFSSVFRRVQQDTASYYVLGYHSTNPARDGRFRRITVRVKRSGVKLQYRPGYYAPRDFQHFNKADREEQLEEELASELPSTDLRVYLSTAFFRIRNDQVFTDVSVLVPGSEIPFTQSGNQDRASLDVLGAVQNEQQQTVGRIRDTVKVAMPETPKAQRKNVQYNTAFVLPPGKYHLKVIVRENQTGKIGSFQTDLAVPNFKAAPVKTSSILLAGQKQPAPKHRGDNPLTRNGMELIPNVTHVFSQKQHLYLYYEVYDPTQGTDHAEQSGGTGSYAGGANAGRGRGDFGLRRRTDGNQAVQGAPGPGNKGIHLMTNVLFFKGRVKAYETPLVDARRLNVPKRHAAVFQLDIPLAKLRPGLYMCQVNVIDDVAGKFVFRRLPLDLIE